MMASVTMDAFINRFLDLLHYVPYIKNEKLKIQYFWGVFLPIFERELSFTCVKLWALPYTKLGFAMSMES